MMLTVTREEFTGPRADVTWLKLFDCLKSMHKVADETMAELLAHRATVGYRIHTRHFVKLLGAKMPIHASYDVWSTLKDDNTASVAFITMQVYDNQMEFELARVNVNSN